MEQWDNTFSRDPVFPMLVSQEPLQYDLGYRQDIRPGRVFNGLYVDVMDQDGPRVRIHFIGWNAKFDMWIPLGSLRMVVHHTFTPRWREDIAVGTEIGFCPWKRLWYRGVVTRKEKDHIRVESINLRFILATNIYNEDIALVGVHLPEDRESYRRRYTIFNTIKKWPRGASRLSLIENGGYDVVHY